MLDRVRVWKRTNASEGIGNGSRERISNTQSAVSVIRCGEYPPKDGRASAVQNTTSVQYNDGGASLSSIHSFISKPCNNKNNNQPVVGSSRKLLGGVAEEFVSTDQTSSQNNRI